MHRSHADIISAKGASKLIELAGLDRSIHTVRSWQQRGSIPGEYWAAIANAGLATLEELAQAAASRRNEAA